MAVDDSWISARYKVPEIKSVVGESEDGTMGSKVPDEFDHAVKKVKSVIIHKI